MQGNGKNSVWDPSQKSEKKQPGSSMPVCAAGPWIQMQVLFPSISNALAHLDSAPAAPSTIKTL